MKQNKTKTADWLGHKSHTCPIHPNWVGSSGIRNGPTHRKSDRKRLRKIHWDVYRGCKMLADRLHRTRPVSLCVGSTERKSDRERLGKIHWSVYRGCKMLADRLRWTRTDTIRFSFCRFDWAKSDRERLRKIHWGLYIVCEMFAELLHRTRTVFSGVYLTDSNFDVLKAWVYYFERHRTHRCKS